MGDLFDEQEVWVSRILLIETSPRFDKSRTVFCAFC
jgi:hypothetical protein